MVRSSSVRVRSSSQPLTKMSSSSGDDDPKLPQDVVVEILKRLPVGSLLRFRCVCRSWRSAIDDPRFVALHSSRSALDASNWYLVCLDWRSGLCFLFSNGSLALPCQPPVEIPFVPPPRPIGISCNGLICVTDFSRNVYGQTMYLWNLFTRKHKAVRRSRPESKSLSMGIAYAYEALGFGFDARSNDYKIVSVLYFLDDNSRYFGGTKPRVEIYSLSTDSWRSLECEVPALCGYEPAVFLNGNLHWFAFNFDALSNEGKWRSIVSFDVAGEVFDEMALPEEINSGGPVVVLNDLLAVFISCGEALGHVDFHSFCSVWVMRDYGVLESWTKLYTFEVSALVTAFDNFTWNGELLMEIDGEERVSWNPITGQIANLPLSWGSDLVTVLESLVSL